MKIYFTNGCIPCIVARSQKELDSIPLSWDGSIEIRFGTQSNPCILSLKREKLIYVGEKGLKRERMAYLVRGNSYVEAHNDVAVIAKDNAYVEAFENAYIEAYNNAHVYVHDNSQVKCYHSSVIKAFDNAFVHNMGTCGKVTMYNGWQHAVNHHFAHTTKPCDTIGKVFYLEDRYGAPYMSELWWVH